MQLLAYVSPTGVKSTSDMGTVPFSHILESRPKGHQYAVAKVDKEYWLIDLYASKVTVNREIVMGEYKVFTDSQAAITAARLLL